MAIKGIDISTFQKKVDYNKVKNDGIKFAILRIGYTGYGAGKKQAKDEMFEAHYKGCKNTGIHIGGYFFGRGTSAAEGKKEAEYVLSVIGDKKFDYPIFYDTEDTYYQAKASKSANTAACIAFCDTIKKAGYKTGIYASKSWFNDKLNDADLKDYDHWIAQYYHKCTYTGEKTMWQYTSSGKVNGIEGNVDMNECYVDYVEKKATPVVTPEKTPEKKPTTSTNKTYKTAGVQVVLKKTNLYASSTSTSAAVKKTGTYYIWSNVVINGRIRITNSKSNVGKSNQITGWVEVSDISTSTTTTKKPAPVVKTYKKGEKIVVSKKKFYASSTSKSSLIKRTGTFYIYDGQKVNGRYRVTNKLSNCGKKPAALYVSGWIEL
jgi:GH25 family lysozyme M1 (1,4-beta-N-acetylmuramidase)